MLTFQVPGILSTLWGEFFLLKRDGLIGISVIPEGKGKDKKKKLNVRSQMSYGDHISAELTLLGSILGGIPWIGLYI